MRTLTDHDTWMFFAGAAFSAAVSFVAEGKWVGVAAMAVVGLVCWWQWAIGEA